MTKTVETLAWECLAYAIAVKGDSELIIQLCEQSQKAHKRLAGSFRVIAGSLSMRLYDCANMDEFRAQVAFDANIKLARRNGYSVTTRYFDRP